VTHRTVFIHPIKHREKKMVRW